MPVPESIIELFNRYLAPGAPDTPVAGVVRLIINDKLSRVEVDQLLDTYGIQYTRHFRDSLVDLVVNVIREALRDSELTDDEELFIQALKRSLRLEEGDLLTYRRAEVTSLLTREVERILRDGQVDSAEALHQVALQRAFDLSYDQYLELTRKPVERLVDGFIARITSDGVVTTAERTALERQLLALDTVYSLTATQRRNLDRARQS